MNIQIRSWKSGLGFLWLLLFLLGQLPLAAQSVCLPSPRLLTTLPMGAQRGSEVEVVLTAQNAEKVTRLLFSHPAISAVPKADATGQPIPNRFTVSVGSDCPLGVHEARIQTRLGVSTARAFNVGRLQELTRKKANTSLETAMEIPLPSTSNAFTTRQSIDYYRFAARKGQRLLVDCSARGIDSKLKPVVVIGDEKGRDLLVERRGGALDFPVPSEGTYTIKVHDLTYGGGKEFFYRLSVQAVAKEGLLTLQPSTRNVNAFSWPPTGVNNEPGLQEAEPNDEKPQFISLPCDLSGSFFPAADIDTFEFDARKGEVWWVEVASERLGRPTDPTVVVQQVTGSGSNAKVTDLVELADIPSPVKVSSNGYSYDGPPYNAGSSDVLGRFEVQQDGRHRIQVSDLFGGTRKDPRNVYRLIVRKAQPDFAVVGWSMHMNLRNGDRNALSKPLALRRGAAMVIEVVVVRRDGFNGEIRLAMENLPPGVSAAGMRIPSGASRGHLVLFADPKAPSGMSLPDFYGEATIAGQTVKRKCHWASMRWPVPNAWSEIPSPRLINQLVVSVTGSEYAPLSLVANEEKIWEVTEGSQITIPLVHTRRLDFSGDKISLKTLGNAFAGNAAFDASLTADATDVVLDLAKIKAPPGDYTVAFYGSAVAKYGYNPNAVSELNSQLENARNQLSKWNLELERLERLSKTATDESKKQVQKDLVSVAEQVKSQKAKVQLLEKQLSVATSLAKPKDIVDIVVSKPIKVRVQPAKKGNEKND